MARTLGTRRALIREYTNIFKQMRFEQLLWRTLGNCYQDTSGLILCGVGDAIAFIADKTGNGWHATQGTGTNRYILRRATLGTYYAEMDSTNDGMVTSYTPASGTQVLCLASADEQTAFASKRIVNSGTNNSLICPNRNALVVFTGGVTCTNNTGSTSACAVVLWKANSNNWETRINNTAYAGPNNNDFGSICFGASGVYAEPCAGRLFSFAAGTRTIPTERQLGELNKALRKMAGL